MESCQPAKNLRTKSDKGNGNHCKSQSKMHVEKTRLNNQAAKLPCREGENIYHLAKGRKIMDSKVLGDMLVPRRVPQLTSRCFVYKTNPKAKAKPTFCEPANLSVSDQTPVLHGTSSEFWNCNPQLFDSQKPIA